MYALRNEDGTFNRRHTGNTLTWRGLTFGNLDAMTDAERVEHGIYRLFYPTIRPTELERSTGLAYEWDDAAGTCHELFIIEPLPLEEARATLIARVKAEAGQRLSTTDWRITRAAEGVKPCDQTTLDHRAAIRAASDAYESAVLAAQTTAALAGLSVAWPE